MWPGTNPSWTAPSPRRSRWLWHILKACSQQTNWTELTWTRRPSYTTRYWSRARQRHDADWLHFTAAVGDWRSVQFSSSVVNEPYANNTDSCTLCPHQYRASFLLLSFAVRAEPHFRHLRAIHLAVQWLDNYRQSTQSPAWFDTTSELGMTCCIIVIKPIYRSVVRL